MRGYSCARDRHIWVIEFYRIPNINLLFTLIISRQEISEGMKREYLPVLARLRVFEATDRIDKVFPFYGLSCHGNLEEAGIFPDCKQTAGNLLLKIVTTNLQRTASLGLFSAPRLVRDDELPSWVPD